MLQSQVFSKLPFGDLILYSACPTQNKGGPEKTNKLTNKTHCTICAIFDKGFEIMEMSAQILQFGGTHDDKEENWSLNNMSYIRKSTCPGLMNGTFFEP